MQMFPHSRIALTKNALRRLDFQNCVFIARHSANDLKPGSLAEIFLDKVEKHGGCFHLWGHSWEIEEKGLWNDLEEILHVS